MKIARGAALAFVLMLMLTGCVAKTRVDSPQQVSLDQVHQLGPDSCEDVGGVWTDSQSGCLTPAEVEAWMTSACSCEDFYACQARGFSQYVEGGPGCDLVLGRWVDGGAGPGGDPSTGSPTLPSGAIVWDTARDYVGSNVTVCGDIVNALTASDSEGRPTFLDMGVAYPNTGGVTVVIWEQSIANFNSDPVAAYLDATVCVSGSLYAYEGYVQVEATSPSQIEVIG